MTEQEAVEAMKAAAAKVIEANKEYLQSLENLGAAMDYEQGKTLLELIPSISAAFFGVNVAMRKACNE